jgi:hypothetical protein
MHICGASIGVACARQLGESVLSRAGWSELAIVIWALIGFPLVVLLTGGLVIAVWLTMRWS